MTEIYYKEDAPGRRIDEGRWQPGWSLDFRNVKDAQGYYAGNIRDMKLGREVRVLYVTDINMGVMVGKAALKVLDPAKICELLFWKRNQWDFFENNFLEGDFSNFPIM